jgi:iron complex outermembrane receptor protein
LASAILTRGPFDAASADLEAQLPLLDNTLGVDLCAGYRENFDIDVFRKSHASLYGATFRWRPAAGTEVVPFWSYVTGGARQIVLVVYTDGTLPLPQFRTQDLGVQDWTGWGWHQTTYGAIVKSDLARDRWTLAADLFHSLEHDPLGYDPYLTLSTPRTADSVMDVVPPFVAESTSGELRLSRLFSEGSHRQALQLAVRGRTVDREFGGDSLTDLGTVDLTGQSRIAQPNLTFGPVSRDRTRQLDLGLTLEGAFPNPFVPSGARCLSAARATHRQASYPGRSDASGAKLDRRPASNRGRRDRASRTRPVQRKRDRRSTADGPRTGR